MENQLHFKLSYSDYYIRYHDITKDDMKNGDGLRVTLWVSGCDHKCKNCQNEVTWDPDDGLLLSDNAILEIYRYLDEDYISGITLSGGDPLYEGNRNFIYDLISNINEIYPNKTIWLYTGYTWDEILEIIPNKILSKIDVIVDGPYIEKLRDTKLKWRGSHNQRVINVKNSLKENKIVLYYD